MSIIYSTPTISFAPDIAESSSSNSSSNGKTSLFPTDNKQVKKWNTTMTTALTKGAPVMSTDFILFDMKWKVLLVPPFNQNDRALVNKQYLSAYLILDSAPKNSSAKVDFTIEIFNHKQKQYQSKFQSFEFTEEKSYSGFNEFIELSKLSLFVFEGKCKIQVTIGIVENQMEMTDSQKQIYKHINQFTSLVKSSSSRYHSLYYTLYMIPLIRDIVMKLDGADKPNIAQTFQLQRLFFYLVKNESILDIKLNKAIQNFTMFHDCQPMDFRTIYQEIIQQFHERSGNPHGLVINSLFGFSPLSRTFYGMPTLTQPQTTQPTFFQMLKAELSDNLTPALLQVSLPYQQYLIAENENKRYPPPDTVTTDMSKHLTFNKFPEDFYLADVFSKGERDPFHRYILFSVWIHERKSMSLNPDIGEFYTFVKPSNQWVKIQSNGQPKMVSSHYVMAAANGMSNNQCFHSSITQEYRLHRNSSSAYMLVYVLESQLYNLFNHPYDYASKVSPDKFQLKEDDILDTILPTTTATTTTTSKNSTSTVPEPQNNNQYEELMNKIKQLEDRIQEFDKRLQESNSTAESYQKQFRESEERHKQIESKSRDEREKSKKMIDNLKSENEKFRILQQTTRNESTLVINKLQTELQVSKKESQTYQSEKAKLENKVKEQEKIISKWQSTSGEISQLDVNELITLQDQLTKQTRRVVKAIENKKQCIICWERNRTHLFVPCGHLATCDTCASALVKERKPCPLCRTAIQQAIKTFTI
ncbi:hypothetical protein DLAC_09397 [Tieghemostelium lacteum]|uniref:RING zinc finger-containing protein n=1 Tax=Tieghemostelium lacteum TaxID=361077 RepID=A0A151Z9Y6_TIELA|nr:hypothetical protein DLAC_09397 [Tieghemostelium lacteum]|eukprot:KYQ90759.1 hypothetical protein DLAC_09397 [Tieghemostelium lacteum]